MTLLAYARVSTDQQSADLQIVALKAAGCADEHIFVDYASGALASRPALERLLAFARSGDEILVWRLDRAARNTRMLLDLVQSLQERGIGFRSLTEGIDISTPTGKMMLTVLGSLAEWERAVIRERVSAGMAASRARGVRPGRKPALTAEQVATARILLDRGETVVATAKILHVSRRTIYRALERSEPSPALAAQPTAAAVA